MSDKAKKGLLVRFLAQPGKAGEVEHMLTTAQPWAVSEPGTTAWFGVRFGRYEFGIVDVFPDEAAREAHLNGPVARALKTCSSELFADTPTMQRFDVIADKLPNGEGPGVADTKGMLVTFLPKHGKDAEVAEFLRAAKPLVDNEAGTTAWFAMRLDDGRYGTFDVFPDAGGRFSHLAGHVPREMAKHAVSMFGSVPDPDLVNVVAEKLS